MVRPARRDRRTERRRARRRPAHATNRLAPAAARDAACGPGGRLPACPNPTRSLHSLTRPSRRLCPHHCDPAPTPSPAPTTQTRPRVVGDLDLPHPGRAAAVAPACGGVHGPRRRSGAGRWSGWRGRSPACPAGHAGRRSRAPPARRRSRRRRRRGRATRAGAASRDLDRRPRAQLLGALGQLEPVEASKPCGSVGASRPIGRGTLALAPDHPPHRAVGFIYAETGSSDGAPSRGCHPTNARSSTSCCGAAAATTTSRGCWRSIARRCGPGRWPRSTRSGLRPGSRAESRALITDYLLGQLPEPVAEQTRERLATRPTTAPGRAWWPPSSARWQAEPLPEIPDGSRAAAPPRARRGGRRRTPATDTAVRRRRTGPPASRGARRTRRGCRTGRARAGAARSCSIVGARGRRGGGGGPARRAEQRVVHEAAHERRGRIAIHAPPTQHLGHDSRPRRRRAKAQVVAQINLNPPSGSGCGQGSRRSWSRRAAPTGSSSRPQHVAPNSHNAYAVWLYNSAGDAYRLGFVNPAVGKNGKLQVGQRAARQRRSLQATAAHARDRRATPSRRAQIVLQGPFNGVPLRG